MNCVVINVFGGLVQDVFASDLDMTVYLVDWDAENAADGNPIVAVPTEGGGSNHAHVAPLSLEPLSRLAGTSVERALAVAGLKLPTGSIALGPTPRSESPALRDPEDLNRGALEEIVTLVRDHLYLDYDDQDQPYWNPDKDANGADLVELTASVLDKHGLAPQEPPAD